MMGTVKKRRETSISPSHVEAVRFNDESVALNRGVLAKNTRPGNGRRDNEDDCVVVVGVRASVSALRGQFTRFGNSV